jgi:peptide/nickel transport system substrate-binding protein
MPFTIYPAHYAKQFFPGYTDQAKLDQMAKDEGFEFWYQHYNSKTATYSGAKSNVDLPVIHAWKLTVPPPKQPVVMERNPYYYKVDPDGNQLPYIDRIEHMIVEGGGPQINLRAIQGEVDMQLRHMTFDNYPLFRESQEQGDYRILQWQRGYITDSMICMGVGNVNPDRRELLADKRLHYALSLAINRQEIIEGVFLGVTEPNQISPLPSSPHYVEEYAKKFVERDLDQANAYLDEMGFTERDGDGYRLMPNGDRLTIFFEYAPVFGAWGNIAELLRAQFVDIGLDLNIKEYNRELFTQHDEAGETEMTMWTGSGEFNPLLENTSPFINWQGGQVFLDWYNSGGTEGEEPPAWMKEQWENRDAAKETIDRDEQIALFRKVLDTHSEQMHTIGICTAPPEVVVVKNDFRNVPEEAVSDWPLLSPGNTNPEQYYIRQS